MACIGLVDDLLKVTTGGKGLPARFKLCTQGMVALVAACVLHRILTLDGEPIMLTLPGLGYSCELGWWFLPWATLVIVGSANAVNLTDGLDGLAGGCLVFTSAALAVAGSATAALVPGASEAVVVLGALTGAVLGFLWFNCAPARVFMGDTGSLAIGGLLGAAALALRAELLLVILGGVFVVETVSVILQVVGFRLARRRLLACAPLHHHFQFRGWGETQIVTHFWLASLACATLGVALSAQTPSQDSLARTPADSLLSIAASDSDRQPPWEIRMVERPREWVK
jgi:phospho-N-acetylmuramoyl-pentapeptide-transferase